MELIMINDAKLKVMLTHEDLIGFDMEEGELDYTNTETKRMLWDILNQAKHTIGFDTDGHRVLVQLYPSRGGGCEMFVTKIGSLETDDSYDDEEEHPAMRGRSSSTPMEESRTGAFGFDRLEWMISVCRRLRDSGYEGESRAFRCDDLRYYLFLEEPRLSDYLPLNELSFISEYGTRENARALGHFLCEHGTAICEQGAIEQLGIL